MAVVKSAKKAGAIEVVAEGAGVMSGKGVFAKDRLKYYFGYFLEIRGSAVVAPKSFNRSYILAISKRIRETEWIKKTLQGM